MSVFKEHKTSADRSASDRRRHKQKIERAIKDGIYHIVAEESIIGQEGKKKIRIPVRGIKEYKFIYGDNEQNKKTGSAGEHDVSRGQKVGSGDKKGKTAPGTAPGEEKGTEYYDVEITLEELSSYLFDDLDLPDLEKKQLKKILSEKFVRHGYRSKGIRPRLDKKKTVIRKLRRKASAKRLGTETDENERFPFHDDDLKYKHVKKSEKESSNAVIFFLMDVSGSMTTEKKYLARSFFFLLYHFIRYRYENTELVFIAHDTSAYVCNEDQFFKRGNSGGTLVSSGVEKVIEVVNKNYHPDFWNIYVFHCSDGDNWPSDTEKTNSLTLSLKEKCQLYGYCEIEPDGDRLRWLGDEKARLSNAYMHLIDKSFKVVLIHSKEDIWVAFKRLFGGKINV